MDILLEKQLSTKDRKALDDDQFGLPDERKYPLNDEKRVRSAIQYFRYCNRSKRLELAKNINKRLRELDMKVDVSSSNPFYKYIDKRYLASEEATEENCVTIQIDKMCPAIKDKIDKINKMQIETIDDINTAEKQLSMLYPTLFKKQGDMDTLYIMDEIDKAFYPKYKEYGECELYQGNNRIALTFALFTDCMNSILNKVNFSENISDEIEVLTSIDLSQFMPLVNRKLLTLKYMFNNNKLEQLRLQLFNKNNSSGKPEDINTLLPHILEKNILFYNVKRIMEKEKSKIESEVYIINTSVEDDPYILNINKLKNRNVYDMIKSLETDLVNKEDLGLPEYIINDISQKDVLMLCKYVPQISNVIDGHLASGEHIWYGVNNGKLFYIFKDKRKEDRFWLSELNNDTIYSLINPELSSVKLNLYSIDAYEQTNNGTVTEGFKIDSDGNVTITIHKKKSYMDQYAEGHRILVENYKNKNYESVKHGISYMFTLISVIEQDKRYKDRQAEVVKARAFAINDFKTYLKRIQEIEPRFDFVVFYQSNDYGKKVVNIPLDSIKGIKKLLKAILV